jgi:type VI secretion system protein ImpH
MVSHFFGVEARIVEYVGRWLKLPDDCLCRIGGRAENAQLGITAVLGHSFWECQQKFRIRIGPMRLEGFERLLPHTESFRRLVDLIRNYVGDELLCDVQLILKADEVPRTRLGSYGQLGRTSWLRTKPFERDSEDVVIHESILESLKR